MPARHVERGDRLVDNQQLRPQHQCARDRDALTLAAREFVRNGASGRYQEPSGVRATTADRDTRYDDTEPTTAGHNLNMWSKFQ